MYRYYHRTFVQIPPAVMTSDSHCHTFNGQLLSVDARTASDLDAFETSGIAPMTAKGYSK